MIDSGTIRGYSAKSCRLEPLLTKSYNTVNNKISNKQHYVYVKALKLCCHQKRQRQKQNYIGNSNLAIRQTKKKISKFEQHTEFRSTEQDNSVKENSLESSVGTRILYCTRELSFRCIINFTIKFFSSNLSSRQICLPKISSI